MFLSLVTVAKGIKVTNNINLCTDRRDFHDDWKVENSHSSSCGCTDVTLGGYDSAATIEDGSCYSLDPCVINNVTCEQDFPCYIVSCNSDDGGSCTNLTAVPVDTECDDQNANSTLDSCQARYQSAAIIDRPP